MDQARGGLTRVLGSRTLRGVFLVLVGFANFPSSASS